MDSSGTPKQKIHLPIIFRFSKPSRCSSKRNLGLPYYENNFWEAADKLPMIARPTFKDTEDYENQQYIALFDD